MRSKIVAVIAALGVALSGPCFAWSENGHQTVGAIADILIQHSNAETQVKSILGTVNGQQLTLQQVAVWADCARSVVPGNPYTYNPGKYKIQACAVFEDAAGKQAMQDYGQRNNSNCPYEGKHYECHKAFHFADVDIEHNTYSTAYVGTHDYDVVHAIDAAIFVLQGQPSHAPFNFASKREALMLLVHFMGDLHQPLHVGAVYLNPADGSDIDPDAGSLDPETETAGGNLISGTGGNLHSQWDKTKFPLTDASTMKAFATEAKGISKTKGDYMHWAEIWAGDTITVAQQAFQGVSFAAKADKAWPSTFDDRGTYVKNMQAIQKQQVIKGGARLANLLTTIWPN
jgi:hypothetical protein